MTPCLVSGTSLVRIRDHTSGVALAWQEKPVSIASHLVKSNYVHGSNWSAIYEESLL